MKTYNAEFDENNIGVFAISLVENPAMEGNFVALSKDAKIEFKTVDEEQRILMGLVLEPNKPIYRNENGEEFNIVFSNKIVKELSHNFFKAGHQNNSSIEHNGEPIKGVTFVESWIVEDSNIDKSANFGFSYPKGSWVATMKVDSDEIWNEYVKSGKVLGFSIDAFLKLKEVKLKSNIEMSEIKTGFAKLTDDLLIALNLKETEVVEEVVEEVKQEATAEEVVVEEIKEEVVAFTVADIKETLESVLVEYSNQVDAKIETIKAEFSKVNETLKAEIVELSKAPAATAIKATPTQKEGVKLSLVERLNNKLN